MRSFFRSIVLFILTIQARIVLFRKKPYVVAVTGNVGKTTTKNAIAALLPSVRYSKKSFNSEFGVPLTILDLPTGWNSPSSWAKILMLGFVRCFSSFCPSHLVLEVGLEYPGDIYSISKWLKADVVLLTHLADIPVHLEHFPSREALFREKASLFKSLKPSGILVYCADDPHSVNTVEIYGKKYSKHTYGFSLEADTQIEDCSIVYEEGIPSGMSVILKKEEFILPGRLGIPSVYSLAAAFSVLKHVGIKVSTGAVSTLPITPGRMRALPGKGGSVIIDDSYNASPVAALRAIELMGKLKVSKKIVVLGQMAQLGGMRREAENKVASAIILNNIDTLVTVGDNVSDIASFCEKKGVPVVRVDTHRKAFAAISPLITRGSAVLVKGSQVARMEKVVSYLVNDGVGEEDLVRQDEYWKSH